jgi:hypothetical protein
MTKAQRTLVYAVTKLEMPEMLIDRASVLLMSREGSRLHQLKELTDDVRLHWQVDGADLEVCVNACIMLAALRLAGRLPTPA